MIFCAAESSANLTARKELTIVKYETLEDLQRAEEEIKEVDNLIGNESDMAIKAMLQEASVALGAGVGGIAGGGVALYFAGVAGFGAAGITSGLAAIGGIIGGGMLAGGAILVAAPLALTGGAYFLIKFIKRKRFNEARNQLRRHAVARRDFLKKLIENQDNKDEMLAEYRMHLNRLIKMIEALG